MSDSTSSAVPAFGSEQQPWTAESQFPDGSGTVVAGGPGADGVWEDAPNHSRNRMVLVVGGSLLAALGVAGAGYLVLSSGGSDVPSGGSGVVAAPGQVVASDPMPASTTTTLPPAPVALNVNARNPFVARVGTKGSGGGGAGAAEGTGEKAGDSGSGSSAIRETAVVTTTVHGEPVTVTTTKTKRDESVWLTLTALDDPTGTEKKSKFIVNGKNYSRFPGETFGEDDRFTYISNQQDDLEKWCALVSYVDEEYIICPNEQIKVH